MTVSFNLKSGEGMMFGTLLRKLAINCVEEVRPIAFSFDSKDSNLLYNNDIAEDTLQFVYSLEGLKFKPLVRDDFIKLNVTFNKKLYSDDLCSDEIECLTKGVVLQTNITNTPVNLQLIFRKCTGNNDVDDNQNFLLDKKILNEGYDMKLIPSTHSIIKLMKTEVKQTGLDNEVLNVTIEDKRGELDEKELLKRTLDIAIERLDSMRKQLNSKN